jgi:hypothetical protein
LLLPTFGSFAKRQMGLSISNPSIGFFLLMHITHRLRKGKAKSNSLLIFMMQKQEVAHWLPMTKKI